MIDYIEYSLYRGIVAEFTDMELFFIKRLYIGHLVDLIVEKDKGLGLLI